ncbi:hypothetical protein AB205_0138700 [Aquarana catesbeiana]|uniref:Uncharacterized protein n=1 Tax=Aquarana catesbeiana TaxID=8400 RepID=A0A2G9RMW7_AQUCT|nr:hypothetical protein AB205_0138700 [Aquarana catesbeiana]
MLSRSKMVGQYADTYCAYQKGLYTCNSTRRSKVAFLFPTNNHTSQKKINNYYLSSIRCTVKDDYFKMP